MIGDYFNWVDGLPWIPVVVWVAIRIFIRLEMGTWTLP